MASYPRNKLLTALALVRRIRNWPEAWRLRLRRHHRAPSLLHFRDGLHLHCRGGTRDWDVIHELIFAGSYHRALAHLARSPGSPRVLDLGGNIGLFSLLAARAHPRAEVHTYEPGPPNYLLLEQNLLANPDLQGRIHLHRQAVGGHARRMDWHFDEHNPGGSSLYGSPADGPTFPVEILDLPSVIAGQPVDLLKIDIEGAEYEFLSTPPEVWQHVSAIALELHDDPTAQRTPADFLAHFRQLGFHIQEESVASLFLHRK